VLQGVPKLNDEQGRLEPRLGRGRSDDELPVVISVRIEHGRHRAGVEGVVGGPAVVVALCSNAVSFVRDCE